MGLRAVLARRQADGGEKPQDGIDEEALWRQVVRAAHGDSAQEWKVLALWLVLPRLRGAARRLRRGGAVDLDDVEAGMALGFFQALDRADPEQAELAGTLVKAAWRGGSRSARVRAGVKWLSQTSRWQQHGMPGSAGPGYSIAAHG